MQAAGRIHRLGQTRDIFIRRYCFRDSIEEAVVALIRWYCREAVRAARDHITRPAGCDAATSAPPPDARAPAAPLPVRDLHAHYMLIVC